MEIVEYVRDKKRRPYGVLYAYPEGSEVRIGFSKCNTKKDKFNKELGIEIAKERAKKRNITDSKYFKSNNCPTENIPKDVLKSLPIFIKRCKKYYKDKVVPEEIKYYCY